MLNKLANRKTARERSVYLTAEVIKIISCLLDVTMPTELKESLQDKIVEEKLNLIKGSKVFPNIHVRYEILEHQKQARSNH